MKTNKQRKTPMGMLRALDFGFGFATNWCVILGKAFDINEFLFLLLEIDKGDLWGLPAQLSYSLIHLIWPMLCLTYSRCLINI